MPEKTFEEELDSIDYEPAGEDEPVEEPAEEPAEETEGDSDDTKTEVEEDPAGETESEEEDSTTTTTEAPEDGGEEGGEETEELDDTTRIGHLVAEIERLSGLIQTPPAETEGIKAAVTSNVPPKEESAPTEETIVDFVGDLDMDDVASHSETLNVILNKVMQKGIEIGKGLNQNYFKQAIPQVVLDHVNQFSNNKNIIDQFYSDNPDLANVKQVVKACATQVVGENPEMQWEDVLKKSADNTRKTLGLKNPTAKMKVEDPANAAFATQKGGQRKKSKKVSKLQQELDEL